MQQPFIDLYSAESFLGQKDEFYTSGWNASIMAIYLDGLKLLAKEFL
jgi:hypothetical protein